MAFTLEPELEPQGELERALLVHVELRDGLSSEALDEFHNLVASSGVSPVAQMVVKRDRPDPALFIGSGKAEEIRQRLIDEKADVVLFNHALSPGQERNLERAIRCRVLDRTGLILAIFAQRARTHEGRLQVELAQLSHLSTRLVRGWTHLERQKGGIGMRGPGETQLETDRRLVRDRIRHLQKRLEKVRKQRAQGRRARERSDVPVVSLVGYTNAGKSTLFNHMTSSDVYVADQLFATLDPTIRRVKVPGVGPLVLADTVGFIRHLPHRLVEAFHATLEEATKAELLIHVVDCSSNDRDDNIRAVDIVLKDIGAEGQPQLHVFNKVDLTDHEPCIERDEKGMPCRVWLSATTSDGIDLLYRALSERLSVGRVERWVKLPLSAGRLRAGFYEAGEVLAEDWHKDGSLLLKVSLSRKHFERLLRDNRLTEPELDVPDSPE